MRFVIALVSLFIVAIYADDTDDELESRLDVLTKELEGMHDDDRRGNLKGMQLGKKGAASYDYTVGQKIVISKEITFKRAKGKTGRKIPAGTVGKISSVPGDSEGSVAEVKIENTVFDAKDNQIVPQEVWEIREKERLAEIERNINWGDRIKGLLTKHAPKKLKKLPNVLKAWAGKEKQLYQKLEAEHAPKTDEL